MKRTTRALAFAAALPPVVLMLLLVGFPVVVGIIYSLGHTGGFNQPLSDLAQHQTTAGGWGTFAVYQSVLASRQFVEDFVATVWVTAVSVVVVLVLAWAIALYLRLSDSLVARALSALSVVPMFIPVVIASYAILAFWSGTGLVRSVATDLHQPWVPALAYTLPGVTLGQIWVNLSFAVLLITSGLQAVPDDLLNAARDVGASLPRILLTIMFPMARLPTVIVATFTAIGVMGSFTIPYVIGPPSPTLLGAAGEVTFQAFNEPQQAQVMAVVLFVLAIGVGVAYIWANARGDPAAAS